MLYNRESKWVSLLSSAFLIQVSVTWQPIMINTAASILKEYAKKWIVSGVIDV